MPPGGSSQKGTGKKGAGAIARQRSRNTTPSSIPPQTTLPPVETFESEHFELKFDLMRNLTYEDLFEQGASSSAIPDARNLDGISGRLQKLQDITEKRGAGCDRGMRLLAGTRRDRMDERAREEEEERLQREADEDRRATKKRRKDKDSKEKDSLAPQETNIGKSGWPLILRNFLYPSSGRKGESGLTVTATFSACGREPHRGHRLVTFLVTFY